MRREKAKLLKQKREDMHIKWKKIIITALDIVLAIYLIVAVTSWNKPDESEQLCTKANINISGSNNTGFLTATEIKQILEKAHLCPLNKKITDINPHSIEEALKVGPFINTAQCYKTKDGHVSIYITQCMPVIRIKSSNGADYYLDDNGGILPNSKYTSDLIIAVDNIDSNFAHLYITPLAKAISAELLWLNQIEQINVLPDRGVELAPRVGNHIIFMDHSPKNSGPWKRKHDINILVRKKLPRLKKLYRYGLSQAGWNKYSRTDIEFDDQIICKRCDERAEKEKEDALLKKAQSEQVEDVQRTEEEERDKARKEVKRQEDASVGLTE